MGPKLIWTGVMLIIVAIVSPILFQLGPFGRTWWPENNPFDNPRGERVGRNLSVIFGGIGTALVIVGIVVAARS